MILRALAVALVCAAAMHGDAAESVSEEWPRADKQLLGAALGLMAIDWGQTRDLATRYEEQYQTPVCADPATRRFAEPCATTKVPRYQEYNPLLPKHPTLGDVNRYFAVAMLGTAALSYALPARYRRPLLGSVIVLESVVVLRNHSIGLRVTF